MNFNYESEVNMKKRVYESPLTTCVEVELESGILAGSIGDSPSDSAGINIDEQTPGVAIGNGGEGFTTSGDETWNDKWD